jgi:ribonuclease HII
MYVREHFAGVDEVGRGPLAGAVVAGVVILDPFVTIEGLRDSKQLSVRRREELDAEIKSRALYWALGRAEVHEIDEINILQASMLAMVRAVENLPVKPDYVMVDGNRTPDFGCESDWLVKGDDKLDVIMAASIIAKVSRDKEMEELDKQYPGYGLARHKGYPTRMHLQALDALGPCEIHRKSFAPVRDRLAFLN